jgi:ABC-2 type transport system ATP-binding protein
VTALALEHLGHCFGARAALSDVSFKVATGAFAVLLGLNGAGKTTLLSLATGLYKPQAGDVRVFGHSLRREPLAALARLGVVFQAPTLDLDLTVAENLHYHAALHGLSRREVEARTSNELDRFGLCGRAAEKVRALSGGLRRRVEIARALLHQPRLLLLDEATAGLDAAARRAILAHVRSLCRERNMGVLWATHLMDEVEPSDQVLVLHEGRLLWSGPAEALPDVAGARTVAEAFLTLTSADL